MAFVEHLIMFPMNLKILKIGWYLIKLFYSDGVLCLQIAAKPLQIATWWWWWWWRTNQLSVASNLLLSLHATMVTIDSL